MKIDLLTVYINEKDFYGFDLLSVNSKCLLSIAYDKFFKRLQIEIFFKPLYWWENQRQGIMAQWQRQCSLVGCVHYLGIGTWEVETS